MKAEVGIFDESTRADLATYSGCDKIVDKPGTPTCDHRVEEEAFHSAIAIRTLVVRPRHGPRLGVQGPATAITAASSSNKDI